MAAQEEPPRTWLSHTEFLIYASFSVLVFVGALGYGVWTSWEPAGTVLLFLCSGLFAIVAGYLWLRERLDRTVARDDDVLVEEAEEPYLPHASIWPLEVGAGMTLSFAGLAMGRWILIPGVVLVLHGLIGWILQSRRRDLG